MSRARPVTTPRPAKVRAAGTGRRCSCCGNTYPVLVDDVLCIRCDAILYPGLEAAS